MSDTSFAGVKAIQTVSLTFHRFPSPGARLWAFGQMLLARFSLPRVPGLYFWKLLGSGTGEGFAPLPNTAVYAILATWPDRATAERQLRGAPVFRRYRRHASDTWTVFLRPVSVRGAWSGRTPFTPQTAGRSGPLASLTRASVRLVHLPGFWRRVPAISRRIGCDSKVLFKIGVGEIPWLHQVTFSIWPDESSMTAFARDDGPHARAIRAVRDGGWFSEELYARFQVIGEAGAWGGSSPIARAQAMAPCA
jgi:spheroidene monooxygenase